MNLEITGKYCFLILAFYIFPSFSASASGWAMFSEHEKMKGYVVAEVGNVSEVVPPFKHLGSQAFGVRVTT